MSATVCLWLSQKTLDLKLQDLGSMKGKLTICWIIIGIKKEMNSFDRARQPHRCDQYLSSRAGGGTDRVPGSSIVPDSPAPERCDQYLSSRAGGGTDEGSR